MAAEQSTRAPASGSILHAPAALSTPGSAKCADVLSELLGRFCDAISVVGVTSIALEKASEEEPSDLPVGMIAVTLSQALQMLNSVYEQLDRALIGLRSDREGQIERRSTQKSLRHRTVRGSKGTTKKKRAN